MTIPISINNTTPTQHTQNKHSTPQNTTIMLATQQAIAGARGLRTNVVCMASTPRQKATKRHVRARPIKVRARKQQQQQSRFIKAAAAADFCMSPHKPSIGLPGWWRLCYCYTNAPSMPPAHSLLMLGAMV